MGLRKLFDRGYIRGLLRNTQYLFKSASGYYRWILLYIAVGLVCSGLSVYSGVLSKDILDDILGERSGLFFILIVIFGVVQMFSMLCNVWRSRLSSYIESGIEEKLRNIFLRDILLSKWEDVQGFQKGDLLSRITGDISNISSSVLRVVADTAVRVFQSLLILVVVIYYSRVLALIALIGLPFSMLVAVGISRMVGKRNRDMKEKHAYVFSFLGECFENITFVKSFNLVGNFTERFESVGREYREFKMGYSRMSAWASFFGSLLQGLVGFLCFAWCVYELWLGRISYGTMVMFLGLFGSLSGSVNALVYVLPLLVNVSTSVDRLRELIVLDKEEEIENTAVEIMGIKASDVTIGYRDHDVLKGVSFSVLPGEVVGLVGETGCGKTSLLKTLLGLLDVKGGKLYLESSSFRRDVGVWCRSCISYVPQENVLFGGSIRYNLLIGLDFGISDEEIFKILRVVCLEDFVMSLPSGLDTEILEKGSNLSVGQAQRLSIARALIRKKPVLLLDEATSALDEETERKVLEGIKSSIEGVTCIVVTHRKSLLGICSRVFIVDSGNVSEVNR